MYKRQEYVGVDACAVNLMRPAMYAAYHHITVMGREDEPCTNMYDVAGSLCENNDKFTIDRMLPEIRKGRFPFGSGALHLNLATYHNSLARSTKSTWSLALPLLVSTRFQVLFHSPPGVLFTFPSRYFSLSVTG